MSTVLPAGETREDGYLVSKRRARFVFTLLFLLYLFNYVDREHTPARPTSAAIA